MAQLTDRLVKHILGEEGGWANDPDDHGGKTMRGVTWGTYNSLALAVLGRRPHGSK